MPGTKAILFDVDYTLCDSSEAIVECMNYAFGKVGLPPQSPNEIRLTIGRSLPATFAHFTGNAHLHLLEDFRKYFREKGDLVMVEKTLLFEEVPETMRQLRQLGLILGIVSTKFTYRIMDILNRENIRGLFDLVQGGELSGRQKPEPDGLLIASEKLKLATSEIIYVGDSVVDAGAAASAGVRFVAVLSGMTPADDFNPFPKIAIIDSVKNLPGIVKSLS